MSFKFKRVISGPAPTIPVLYAAWSTQRDAIRVTNMPDIAIDDAAEYEAEIAAEALALPPATVEHLAMKLIICTDGGQDLAPAELIREAEQIARRKPKHSISSSLLDLQDRLSKIEAMIRLVDYALEGMSGDDDGSVDALQTGMSQISEQIKGASGLLNSIRGGA